MDLTPRTKVRALLADSDGSDDDISRLVLGPAKDKSERDTKTQQLSNQREGKLLGAGDSSEDEDDVVPTARRAARMQGLGNGRDRETGSHEEGLSTYEKIKRQLLAGNSEAAAGQEDKDLSESAGGSGEESGPKKGKLPRRLKRPRSEISIALPCPAQANQQASVVSERQEQFSSNDAGPSATRRSSHTRTSPGLFVSPEKPLMRRDASPRNDDLDDLPVNPGADAGFLALVARKRKERRAREKLQRPKARKPCSGTDTDKSSGDDEAGKKLTQEARPTRRAGKKALEEMNRETQRLSRNMQLAHQERTKKTITKESFFARFNFNPNAAVSARAAADPAGKSDMASPMTGDDRLKDASENRSSDFEPTSRHETPPSSPPSTHEAKDKPQLLKDSMQPIKSFGEQDDQDLPTLEAMVSQTKEKLKTTRNNSTRETRAVLALHAAQDRDTHSESEDDLEIIGKDASRRFAVFDRLPRRKIQQPRSRKVLRALANLTSPKKQHGAKKSTGFMTPAQLAFDLQRRAREQAQAEKAGRLQDLRNRGIIVQTVEEREQDQIQLENILEKARQEAVELSKKEKADAKREGKKGVYEGQFPDSDEEDGDWDGSEDELDQAEASGLYAEINVEAEDLEQAEGEQNEDDEENTVSEDEVSANEEQSTNLVQHEAAEHESSESEAAEDEDEDAEAGPSPAAVVGHIRVTRRRIVKDEDDDEQTSEINPSPVLMPPPASANGFSAFGFAANGNRGLSMTQAFAATIADDPADALQGDNMLDTFDPEQDSLAFLRRLPPPELPGLFQSQHFLVADSQISQTAGKGNAEQRDVATQEISLDFSLQDTQVSVRGGATQWSDIPDPTQDVGFQVPSSPGDHYAVPHSTVETVLLHAAKDENPPVAKNRRRLRRPTDRVIAVSDEEDNASQDEAVAQEEAFDTSNAFDVMRKAAKDPTTIKRFDKKTSEAKTMVEEQAIESEDEYAGVGGASDDESNGELDEEMRGMIDEGDVNVNERKLAALFADKERIADEKQIAKLYRDINNGGLRRKRGADFELSDSEDDGEARRRKKQQEFARMRKALMEDENIGKIAENPKKSAFLRAIEDRDKDDDFEILDEPAEMSQTILDSQTEPAAVTPAELHSSSPKRKRTLEESKLNDENRAPFHLRRPKKSRPSSLAEIRDSVSFLMEEPSIVHETQESDCSEPETDDDATTLHKEPLAPREAFSDRRRANPVIDRILLKRNASSSDRGEHSTTTLAFHAPSLTSTSNFRVPNLLRRATTTASLSKVESEATRRAATEAKDAIRRGGTKKSSVNYYVREKETRATVVMVEKRMERERVRAGKMRGSALGALGLGTFD